MLGNALERLLNIDKMGLLALIIAGFITYGARFIAMKVLNAPPHKVFKATTILKVAGLFIGLFGLFRITR